MYCIVEGNKILRSSDLQFGFKERASETQCTCVMNAVVSYHDSNGSDVLAVL